MGEEKLVAMQIMRKALTYEQTEEVRIETLIGFILKLKKAKLFHKTCAQKTIDIVEYNIEN